jgi:hypothetical protein
MEEGGARLEMGRARYAAAVVPCKPIDGGWCAVREVSPHQHQGNIERQSSWRLLRLTGLAAEGVGVWRSSERVLVYNDHTRRELYLSMLPRGKMWLALLVAKQFVLCEGWMHLFVFASDVYCLHC